MNKPALFLDIDHTTIKPKSGNTFPEDKDDWMWIDGILDAITKYYVKGYQIVFVSNQGGVEYDYVTQRELNSKFDKMRGKLATYLGNRLGKDVSMKDMPVYYCPSMSSYDRKPNPGMAYQAALDHELSLKASIMVGDKESDEQFAENAGIGTFHYIDEFLTLI